VSGKAVPIAKLSVGLYLKNLIYPLLRADPENLV
jgi:hypothetical protein